VLVVCAAGYGGLLAWAGTRAAAATAAQQLPELCQVAIQSTL
jgi:hypothetical protein